MAEAGLTLTGSRARAAGEPGPTAQAAGFGTRLLYGLGSVAFGVKDNGFQTILLLFYNQVVGLPAAAVGLAIMIALAADAFLDPIIGQISDNLRTPWGRRHPLMYAAAVPLGLSYLLLWSPPHVAQSVQFLYLVGAAIFVRIFVSLYEVPSAALAPELASDYAERTAILSYRIFFQWFGGLFVYFLALAVFLRPDAAHPVGQLNPVGYARYGLFAAGLMTATILISAAGTHGRIKHLRQPDARALSAGQLLREAIEALSHRSFLVLLVSSLFSSAASGLSLSMTLYFYTYLWGFTGPQIALFAVVSLGSAFLAMFLVRAVARHDKRYATIGLCLGGLCVSSTPLTLRLLNAFPPNGSPVLFPTIAVCSLFGLAAMIAASMSAASMIADVVEDSEIRTGRRSEGLFFSMNSFILKAVSGVGIFLASALLAIVRFPAHAAPGQVDPAIIRNLALVYLPTLVVLFGVSCVCLMGYRITRAGHEANLKQLAEGRRAGPIPPTAPAE